MFIFKHHSLCPVLCSFLIPKLLLFFPNNHLLTVLKVLNLEFFMFMSSTYQNNVCLTWVWRLGTIKSHLSWQLSWTYLQIFFAYTFDEKKTTFQSNRRVWCIVSQIKYRHHVLKWLVSTSSSASGGITDRADLAVFHVLKNRGVEEVTVCSQSIYTTRMSRICFDSPTKYQCGCMH